MNGEIQWNDFRKAKREMVVGWTPKSYQMLIDILSQENPKTWCELGVFAGGSILYLCQKTQDTLIACIDTWETKKDTVKNHFKLPRDKQEILEHQLALNQDFMPYVFMNNVMGFQKRIRPFQCNTIEGLKHLRDIHFEPEFIYIDANHNYKFVLEDLQTSIDLFPNAVILGDDFSESWKGVQQAVREIAQQHDYKIYSRSHTWIFVNDALLERFPALDRWGLAKE